MGDIKTIIKSIEQVVEHSESDLHKAAKKEEYTPDELETIKNIAKIAYYHQVLKAMDDADDEEGYSERGYSRRGGYSKHYPMGQVPRTGYNRNYSRYGNSYRNSYGMDESKAIVMEKLEDAMINAMDERERQAIEQYMNKMGM